MTQGPEDRTPDAQDPSIPRDRDQTTLYGAHAADPGDEAHRPPQDDDATPPEEQPPRPRPRRHDGAEDPQIRDLAIELARLMNDRRCEDIAVFDVRGLSEVTDYIVIGSGTSARQARSVAAELDDVAEPRGFERYGRETDEDANWIVVDFVDVVAHLFEPVTRAHYDLEMLWGDAPQVAWRRAATDQTGDGDGDGDGEASTDGS